MARVRCPSPQHNTESKTQTWRPSDKSVLARAEYELIMQSTTSWNTAWHTTREWWHICPMLKVVCGNAVCTGFDEQTLHISDKVCWHQQPDVRLPSYGFRPPC